MKYKVIIGCRDDKRANDAINDVKQRNPKAIISQVRLDLASLQSVRQFVKQINETETQIDVLINNAAVMFTPEWQTVEGYELGFGISHLGDLFLIIPYIKYILSFILF